MVKSVPLTLAMSTVYEGVTIEDPVFPNNLSCGKHWTPKQPINTNVDSGHRGVRCAGKMKRAQGGGMRINRQLNISPSSLDHFLT